MRNFDEATFLVIWELTQACDLACVHCRACAIDSRNPFELTTEEGFRLLEEVRTFGDPLMVFTGGDPLKRPDLLPLLEKSVSLGLRTAVTPSATPLLTNDAIEKFKDCGVARMAISLDGPDAQSHDGFRRVEGSFDRTISALRHVQEIGLQTQVNTTVTRHNMGRLNEIAQVMERCGGLHSGACSSWWPPGGHLLLRTSPPRNTKRSLVSSTIFQNRTFRHQDHRGPTLSSLCGTTAKSRGTGQRLHSPSPSRSDSEASRYQ